MPTKSQGLKRETILLAAVALIGVAGLVVLQTSRNRPENRNDQKSLLRSANNAAETPVANQRSVQTIPGNLLHINDDSEVGKPYVFHMTNHAQGAVYELDPGDGSGRKPFDGQGAVRHTYRKAGDYTVTLYARFEGEEAVLQVIRHGVGQPIDKSELPVDKKSKKPIIDY
jgi:hypothetical protein